MLLRWQSVDGHHKACDSCDVDRQFLAASAEQSPSLMPTRPLEPVVRLPAARQAEEPHTEAKQAPANYFRFRPPSHLRASAPMKRANSGSVE